MARVVFLGTPEFGVPVLQALIERHEVVAVVTQPDRAAGRGQSRVQTPPVKELAQAHGLRVLQPVSLRRDKDVLDALRAAEADVFVLAAFGQILRPNVLAIPRRGCIGVHASLLPELRGAAPIAAAILQGKAETGITLMLTDPGMDTGPIIAQRSLPIRPDDTTATLTARLAVLGADLLIEILPAWLAGEIEPQPQDNDRATYAPPIDKAEGAIDWSRTAIEIDRQVRAYTPWPGAYSFLDGRQIKVLRAHPRAEWRGGGQPGAVVQAERAIGVVTGEGLLILDEIQLEGRKALPAEQFARGQRGFVGGVLGSHHHE